MPHRQVRIAQLGTFDVANYGDLLFPLLAHRRLRPVFPDLCMDVVSPTGGKPVWFDAAPTLPWQDFADRIDTYDAIIVGGGNIIRLNPTDLEAYQNDLTPLLAYARLWATFAELGRAAVPVLWNAPGVPAPIPEELLTHLRPAMTNVRYMAVRDEGSRANAEPIMAGASLTIVPDPAWDLPLLWQPGDLARARSELWARSEREVPKRTLAIHLNRRYLAHETPHEVAARIDAFARDQEATAVLVAIGPCHGDDGLAREVGTAMRSAPLVLDAPQSLLEIAAMIAGSDLYVGSSMHGFITAIAFGAPAVIVGSSAMTKFDGLLTGLGLPELRRASWPEALDFAARSSWPDLMNRAASGVEAFAPRLDAHWDRISNEIELSLAVPPAARPAQASSLTPALLGHAALNLWRSRERDRTRLSDLSAAFEAQKVQNKKQAAVLSARLGKAADHATALMAERDKQKQRAEQERLRTAAETNWATALKAERDKQKQRAEQERLRAAAETNRATALMVERDEQKQRAERERLRARSLAMRLRGVEAQVAAYEASTSWRVTIPLRRLRRLLNRRLAR